MWLSFAPIDKSPQKCDLLIFGPAKISYSAHKLQCNKARMIGFEAQYGVLLEMGPAPLDAED
jgi:hypothetical protein